MKIVIIGAGPAGVTVAETVRTYDRLAELVVLSAEPYPPYSPPAMADHFISGTEAHLWRGHDWPQQLGLDYRSGVAVTAIEPDNHRLQLDDGSSIAYDRLVIASGSRLYAPLEGAALPGVYNFKSLSAAESLVHEARSGRARMAVIVGAGFIGMEIALLLRELGLSVVQIEMQDQVMPAMLDQETAAIALDLMRQHGVDVQLNTRALTFGGNGRVTHVSLANGDTLEADLFIAATGVQPNIAFLDGSGIAHRWGINVDSYLQTSAPDIYAAGDVIEAPDRLTGERTVRAIFPNAVAQGRVVGLNLLGYNVAYEGSSRMNSLKHLGLQIMAAGLKQGDEVLESKYRGTMRRLYVQENRLVGFQLVGDVRPAGVLRALMHRKIDLRPIKDHLLSASFGQGTVTWAALVP